MWHAHFEKRYTDITASAIWSAWADVNQWTRWDDGLESVRLTAPFATGSHFTLKPKGGPTVDIEILQAVAEQRFTDLCRFPLARLYDEHELEATADGVIVRNRIRVEGPLGWLWGRLVAADMAKGLPAQTDALVAYARQHHMVAATASA